MDLSKFNWTSLSPMQILMAFVIVIICLCLLGLALPKICQGFKSLWQGVTTISKRQQEHQRHIQQIEDNSKAIKDISAKVDDLSDMLNKFIEDNKQINESIVASVKEIDRQQAISEAKRIRGAIFIFFNDLIANKKKTVGEFRNILEILNDYEELIEKYDIKNDSFPEEAGYIKRKYRKLLDNDAFLKVSEVSEVPSEDKEI